MSQDSLTSFFSALDAALRRTEEHPVSSEGAKGTGMIQSVKDGVLHIDGLPGLKMGEVLHVVDTSINALVMQIDRDAAYAVLLESSQGVREGMAVQSTNRFLAISVDESRLGRVVDPLGNALDEGPAFKKGVSMPLEAMAPSVMERSSVNQPVQTGIVAIDALIPIGRGQRELIIGDRQTGKTTVAIDTILSQRGQNMVCIYVAVGQRESKTAQVVRTLQEHGAMDYTVVVNAGASTSAIMQFLAPYAGAAIGEYFMRKGQDALVIYDDLSKHAVAYREMSLLLRKPPGREAYPGDVFYIHSRLLERAAKLSQEQGGGSLTALPIVETQANDVSAYIPTNVISITDGQIFLESTLFNQGIRPAMNVGISVSRVGSAAQTKIMKKSSGTVKLDLAQYYELAAFSQFASELDTTTKQQLTRGERVVESLKQKAHQPYALWQEILVLRAATGGFLDAIPREQVAPLLQDFLRDTASRAKTLVERIEAERALSDDIAADIEHVLKTFFAKASRA
ncbi:F0F1 ATP synthase subunit alpha [Patescibacteria group bacterium]|jgi:F-type H+-transporting ATPase subunit alpha|nr:F0F1 ATP synthase subunit alpha [Patescibacteria group bacterium]MDQ5919613.1 F-type H+/Na+-transporting ATPase subunit alpha [Patescibacteria group bacterium]